MQVMDHMDNIIGARVNVAIAYSSHKRVSYARTWRKNVSHANQLYWATNGYRIQ